MDWWEYTEKLHSAITALLEGATDRIRSQAAILHDGWDADASYAAGDVREYGGRLYRCLTAHTAQDSWTPDVAPSLWARIMFRDGIRVIPETPTATDAFARGETGWWGDALYRSLMDGNVWTPAAYPAGWEAVVID